MFRISKLEFKHVLFAFSSLILFMSGPPVHAQTAGDFPKPVSEYAEQTGPGTMTFLSYPKYYRDAENRLRAVDTTLQVSDDAQWDYEVTAGIWSLRVRLDGTFQAAHRGDVFTYRFSRLGVGRGPAFWAFDWGEPNWKNVQVLGDTIRWTDVFPDVDVSVRYVHDSLKVDVIVKEALMDSIRSDVLAGKLDAGDFLTAQFEIPQVLIG